MFLKEGIEADNFKPISTGEYNSIYKAEAGKKKYIIKIAPAGIPVLTYEHNLMSAELFWYEQLRTNTNITVPTVCFADLTGSPNFFIMEYLPGQMLNKVKQSKEEQEQVKILMAQMAAQMHKIKNDKYGYIQNELYQNWYLAIKAMTTNIIKDSAAVGKKSPNGERLLTYIDQYQECLEKAECCMVNFDIHPANIIVNQVNNINQYAWIDPERSFWGDRIADFVCLEMLRLSAYRRKN